MGDVDIEALVIYGNSGMYRWNQTSIAYLTNYWGDFMTYLMFFREPDEEPTLFCGITNHLQYIQEASTVDEIRLMIPNPPKQIADRLQEGDVTDARVGIVGTVVKHRGSGGENVHSPTDRVMFHARDYAVPPN